jgi:hypothetical protein
MAGIMKNLKESKEYVPESAFGFIQYFNGNKQDAVNQKIIAERNLE